jgi:hypothetical protein
MEEERLQKNHTWDIPISLAHFPLRCNLVPELHLAAREARNVAWLCFIQFVQKVLHYVTYSISCVVIFVYTVTQLGSKRVEIYCAFL